MTIEDIVNIMLRDKMLSNMEASDEANLAWFELLRLAQLGAATKAAWNRYDLSGKQYWTPDARTAFIKDMKLALPDKPETTGENK